MENIRGTFMILAVFLIQAVLFDVVIHGLKKRPEPTNSKWPIWLAVAGTTILAGYAFGRIGW